MQHNSYQESVGIHPQQRLKPEVCITTLIDERYAAYAPLFTWCCRKAYPQYAVKLFFRGPAQSISGAECIGGIFEDYPNEGPTTTALRFLLPGDYFRDHRYVYITDIDMMIMTENPTLDAFHKEEMRQNKLCYSNSLRNPDHWRGSESLTGLHFCALEWFSIVRNAAKQYGEFLKKNSVRREYDGWMLYRMTVESGLGLVGKYPLVQRHHGIHLGNFRLFKNHKKLVKRMDVWKCMRWMKYMAGPQFAELCSKVQDSTVRNQLAALDKHCEMTVR